MLIKLVLYPFQLVLRLFLYPVLVVRVMQRKHVYDTEKRLAWQSFYSSNRKWLHTWYSEKGLNSKPPVYYDQHKKAWLKLNRDQRRELHRQMTSGINSKFNN